MTDPGYMLSEQAIRKIVDDHRRLSHDVYQLKQELASTHRISPWPRELFWGKTVDGGETYPTNGNTFWVQLIDRTFDEAAGTEAVTNTIGGSAVTVRAHTVDDTHVAEDTVVRVEKRLSREGWRYWIVPDVAGGGIKSACFTGHTNNKNRDTGVSGPTTYIGALNSKDLLLVPSCETGDSTHTDFFSLATPASFSGDWMTILEAGVYRFHWQCRVQWPQLSSAPDGNYGTSGNPVIGAAHQHYYPDNTTNFLTETTDSGGTVDVWDQKLYFSTCSLRLYWDEPPVGSAESDDIASMSSLWAQFNTNANAPEFDLHGLWQRYVDANTTVRVVAFVPDSTVGHPYRVVRQYATLTQLGTDHA